MLVSLHILSQPHHEHLHWNCAPPPARLGYHRPCQVAHAQKQAHRVERVVLVFHTNEFQLLVVRFRPENTGEATGPLWHVSFILHDTVKLDVGGSSWPSGSMSEAVVAFHDGCPNGFAAIRLP